ncbi:hypothetical protein CCZ01_10070, partial [Helicobacter monodelphidis]
AKVTHGALSDYSKGVHILSLEEEKQVKGGYDVGFGTGSDYSGKYAYAWAKLSYAEEDYISEGRGVCARGKVSCDNPSKRRFAEWKSITGSKDFGPAYIVKKNKATSSLGNSF